MMIYNSQAAHHARSLSEAHSYPSLCLPLHIDIQVAGVALVAVYANKDGAVVGGTPLRLEEDQIVILSRSGLHVYYS